MKILIPLHISGFWAPLLTGNPITSGSLGAGLVLYPPAVFNVSFRSVETECSFIFNNSCIDNLSLLKTIEDILGVGSRSYVIIHGSSLGDLGLGYALSSAISIAYSLALIKKLTGSLQIYKAGIVAHEAEVVNLTGLGDVIAQIHGGPLALRLRIGPPTIGIVEKINFKSGLRVVVCELESKPSILTPNMLKTNMKIFLDYGLKAYRKLISSPNIETFFDASYAFSRSVGFLSSSLDSKVRSLIKHLIRRGCVLGYYVKKKLLVIAVEKECIDDLTKSLEASKLCRPKLLTPVQIGTLVFEGNDENT